MDYHFKHYYRNQAHGLRKILNYFLFAIVVGGAVYAAIYFKDEWPYLFGEQNQSGYVPDPDEDDVEAISIKSGQSNTFKIENGGASGHGEFSVIDQAKRYVRKNITWKFNEAAGPDYALIKDYLDRDQNNSGTFILGIMNNIPERLTPYQLQLQASYLNLHAEINISIQVNAGSQGDEFVPDTAYTINAGVLTAFDSSRLTANETHMKFPTGVQAISPSINWDQVTQTQIKKITFTNTVALPFTGTYSFANFINLTNVVLPEVYGVSSINYVPQEAFLNCASLESVVIPADYVGIEPGAFKNCTSLTKVDQAGNASRAKVTAVSDEAFYNATSLTTVTFSENILWLGSRAFYNSEALNELKINSQLNASAFVGTPTPHQSTFVVGLLPEYCFYNSMINTLTFNSTQAAGSIYLPVGITKIGRSAFEGCLGVENLVLPATGGLETIDDNAFKNCVYLAGNITFPDSVTYINQYAFASCQYLAGISLGANVAHVGAFAFYNDRAISSEIIFNSKVQIIGESAFEECRGITHLSFADPEATSTTSVIGDRAFYNCTSLAGTLALPRYFATIGASAFENCGNLLSLIFAQGLQTIGHDAFRNCLKINVALTFPASLTTIGASAFNGCNQINSVVLPEALTSIGANAFQDCSGITGNVTIPNNITVLPEYVFAGCSGINSVTFSNNLTAIGANAFSNCQQIGGVLTIPTTVVTIGNEAFLNCTTLSGLTLPNSLTSIGNRAFGNCIGVTIFDISSWSANWASNLSVGTDAFKFSAGGGYIRTASAVGVDYQNTTLFGNQPLHTKWTTTFNTFPTFNPYNGNDEGTDWIGYVSGDLGPATITYDQENHVATLASESSGAVDYVAHNLVFPDTISHDGETYTLLLGDNIFKNSENLTGSVSINNSALAVGDYAFAGCRNITSINLGQKITKIGDNAFTSTNLIQVEIPNTVETIGEAAFADCKSLTTLTIHASSALTSIGDGAFQDCTSIYSEIALPSTLQTVGDYAFENCVSIRVNFNYAAALQTIGQSAFSGCSNSPNEVVFGSYLTAIGDNAFLNFKASTRINLTNATSLKTIGASAFKNCTGFNSALTLPASLTSIGAHAFENDSKITDLTFPTTSVLTTIAESTFAGCSGITNSITIPNSITTIGANAFKNASKITGLTFAAWAALNPGLTAIGDYAFAGCAAIENALTIPDSVENLGEFAFSSCGKIPSLSLGTITGSGATATTNSKLTSLPNSVFAGCGSISGQVVIPTTVIILGDSAFENCGAMNDVTFGIRLTTGGITTYNTALTSIGKAAFNNCRSLTGELVIPHAINTINEWVFANTGYTSVVFDDALTAIGNSAFKGATQLASVNGSFDLHNIVAIGNSAFDGCTSLNGVLVLSSTLSTIGIMAFRNTAFSGIDLTNLSASSYNAISIGADAFSGTSYSTAGWIYLSTAQSYGASYQRFALGSEWTATYSSKTNPNYDNDYPKQVPYAGNITGTDWIGYNSGQLSIVPTYNEDESIVTFNVAAGHHAMYVAHNLVVPSWFDRIEVDGNVKRFSVVLGVNFFNADYGTTLSGSFTFNDQQSTIPEKVLWKNYRINRVILNSHITGLGNQSLDVLGFQTTPEQFIPRTIVVPSSILSFGVDVFGNSYNVLDLSDWPQDGGVRTFNNTFASTSLRNGKVYYNSAFSTPPTGFIGTNGWFQRLYANLGWLVIAKPLTL